MSPISGNSDHLVKVVSSTFLRCKVTMLYFKIKKYLVEMYFETVKISCYSSDFHSLFLESIDSYSIV